MAIVEKLEDSLPPLQAMSVPARPSELSADWLSACLRAAGVRARVAGFELARIGEGRGFAGQLVRVTLRYESAAEHAPPTLIAKFATDHAGTRETLRALGDERIRKLVDAYVEAWARGDVDALAALLAEDAVFSMPPWAMWWRGRETIAGFAPEAVETCATGRAVPVSLNGQTALACYALDAETGRQIADLIFSKQAERDMTLVLVTHDPALADRCSRQVQVRSGEIVSHGKHEPAATRSEALSA